MEDKKMKTFGKYILAETGTWKNARRHIMTRSDDIDYLRKIGKDIAGKRVAEIYDSKWNLIERVK